jgi:hypothetical protein
MSDRVRSTVRNRSTLKIFDNSDYLDLNLYNSGGNGLNDRAKVDRSITDTIQAGGTRGCFNPVIHTINDGMPFFGNFSWTYASPTTSPRTITCLDWGCQVPLSLSGLPEADWNSLSGQLADQLNGYDNCGSLLAVSIKEMDKTIDMFHNPFSLMKRNWRKDAGLNPAAALAKRGSNYWLEHRYGWNAFYQDLKSAKKSIQRFMAPPTQDAIANFSRRFSATQVETASNDPWQYLGTVTDGWWNYWYAHGMQPSENVSLLRGKCTNRKITYRVGAQSASSAIRTSKLTQAIQLAGVDMRGLVSSLWEIVPYSFVVDWFINLKSFSGILKRRRLLGDDIRNLGFSSHYEADTFGEGFLHAGAMHSLYGTPWYGKWPTNMVNSMGARCFSGQGHQSQYIRSVGMPPISSVIAACNTQGLSLTQGISGVSLILQRLLR